MGSVLIGAKSPTGEKYSIIWSIRGAGACSEVTGFLL